MAKAPIPKSTEKVKNLSIRLHQGVENGELIATWDWNFKNTSGFSYTWEYTNGDSWISASSGTTDVNHKNALYTPPTGALRVRFSVLPVSTTKTKNGAETNVWIVTSPTKLVYNVGRQPIKLTTPSAPSISINLYKAFMTVNYTDLNATGINFFLISDTTRTVTGPFYATLYYGKASIEAPVSPNQTYRSYCIAVNATPYTSANPNTRTYIDSDKSEYSSEVDSPPEGVTITKIESTSETSVKILFDRITNGDKYDVEYTENIENFDRSDLVNSKSIEVVKRSTTYILLSGLETGKHWFFRVRVSNDAGVTNWSNIYDITLGLKPNPPTIWSSTYSAIIDEEVILYWTHNSLDGSKETEALLTFELKIRNASDLSIQTKTETITVPNTKTDDEITTSSYTFNPLSFVFTADGSIIELKWTAQTKGVLDEYSEKSVINTINFYIKPMINAKFGKKNKWYWDPLDLQKGNVYTTIGEVTDFYEETPFTLISFPLYVQLQVTPLFDNHPLECYVSIFAENTYQTLNHVGEMEWVTKGTEIYSRTLTKYYGEHMYLLILTPEDVVLENYQTYKFFARAVMDNGLIAEYETTFDVNFEDVSYSINAEIGFDENNISTYIQPYCVDEDGELIDYTYLSVYRKNFDGEFVEIASGLNNMDNITVIDPHPTLKAVQYRLSVYNIFNGTISFTDLPGYPIPETAIVIQWDDAWTSFESDDENEFTEPVQTGAMLKLPFNVDTSESNTIDSNLVEYIGRKHPVGYYGTQVGQKNVIK